MSEYGNEMKVFLARKGKETFVVHSMSVRAVVEKIMNVPSGMTVYRNGHASGMLNGLTYIEVSPLMK